MFRILRIIASDFVGLVRTCGPATAVRWLAAIATNFRTCMRDRSVGAADAAMGPGPHPVRHGAARATLFGEQVFGGLREIWVRDVYLSSGMLAIAPDATVVDLGTNMGNFTVLALAHGPGVRVVSVDADTRNGPKIRKNLQANGWLGRAEICQHFIGGRTHSQDTLVEWMGGTGPSYLGEDEFVRRYSISRIDFLKCDIEGSEFELLRPGGLILGMTDQLAVEVHGWGGDVRQFIAMLESEGFSVYVHGMQADGALVQAKRQRPVGATRVPTEPLTSVATAMASMLSA